MGFMSLAELTAPAPAASQSAAVCSHCGLPVSLWDIDATLVAQFCCLGCRVAYELIHEHGLFAYYALGEQRHDRVILSGRSYEEFDHTSFHSLYLKRRADGLAEIDLYLEGVHCPSCVWLVERVPVAVPGVLSAELILTRSLVHLVWDDRATRLSSVAGFLDRLGYRPHPFRGADTDALRRAEDRRMITRIGVAGALAGNVMLVAAALYSGWLNHMEAQYEHYFRWLSLWLAVPALFGPGAVFFRGALGALRTRALHMDLPIALALAVGFVRGAINTITDQGPIYFDGVTTLIFLLLVGRFLQQRAQRTAANSAELLYSLTSTTARLLEGTTIREIPVEALIPGMLIEVRPGDSFPADGRVVHGASRADEALLSGESRPVAKSEGLPVYGGTLNLSSTLRVVVEASGESSRLGKMLRDVEAGAQQRAPVVLFADRMAGIFVGVVLLLALGTWLIWMRIDPTRAVDNAIALLIVTCPCALALATPLAITVATGRAARQGILIKNGTALELLGRPARLILDKTGTLTEGRAGLVSWRGPDWVKPLVLALERHSPHPIAAGFQRAWPDESVPDATAIEQTLGGGLRGVVAGRRIVVGSPHFVRGVVAQTAIRPDTGAPGPAAPHLTPVLIAVDDEIVAAAGFGDPIRPEAASVLAHLRAKGWTIGLLSGDSPAVVQAVATTLDIPLAAVRAGASPEEKLAVIKRLALAGPVVMVGDGVNDAAAIAAASVGVGVRGGAEASLAAADVFLADGGIEALARLTNGAERTLNVIRRNIAFSLGYNVIGAALAVTGIVNPLIAAIMMPVSSVTVILTSWRSRTFEADRS